jgi:hypothetical protein
VESNGDLRNEHEVLIEMSEVNIPLARHMHTWKNNIKTD